MQKKGSTFFNIIIIITAIALLGIGGYAAYYYINNAVAVKEAEDAVEEFEKNVIVVAIENEKPKQENQPAVAGNDDQDEEDDQPSSGSGSGSRSYSTTYRGYNMVGTMQIPRTKIKVPIVDVVTINSIAAAVGVLYGPGPNEIGNTVYAAHNYRNGTFFSNNKQLDIGDNIYITDCNGHTVEYTITNVYETDANDFEYATRNTFGKREISLTTCTPNPNIRLIVWAAES